MSTKNDAKRLRSLYYYSAFFCMSSLANGFGLIKLLQFLDPLNPLSSRIKNGVPIGFIFISGVFSFYKVYSYKSQNDKKYTNLWLKSSGSV